MKYNLSNSQKPLISTDTTSNEELSLRTASGSTNKSLSKRFAPRRLHKQIAIALAAVLLASSATGALGSLPGLSEQDLPPVGLTASTAYANPAGSAADHRNRAQDARQRADAADRRAEELQAEIRNLDASLENYVQQAAELAPQVRDATARTTALTEEVNTLQAEVDELTGQITETEEELAHQQELLNNRAVSTYRGGEADLLSVLFGAQDLGDLIARAESIMTVLDHNSQISIDLQFLQRRLEHEKSRLDHILSDVAERRAAAAEAEAELRTLQQRAQTAADTAERLSRERSGMLADTQANADRLRALATEEEAMAAQITRQLSSGGSLGGSTGSGVFQGRMTWPVPGFTRVTSPFGMRNHPIFGGQRMHTGVDIAGPGINGAAVVASGNGRVIASGWRGGYGNTIIIDHGDGVTTLYAHLQSMSVGVGQQVSAGQRIGAVGSTGNSTGPHLHWEVRVNGQPRNPMTF
jgi:murein DD-endopeptidase MepM/ murein hydrolase activator NlpD